MDGIGADIGPDGSVIRELRRVDAPAPAACPRTLARSAPVSAAAVAALKARIARAEADSLADPPAVYVDALGHIGGEVD